METPVFIRKHPAGWLWESVCRDRTTAMSSTQVDRWGKDFRYLHAALPVFGEFEGAAHVDPFFHAAVNPGDRRPVVLVQSGLGIEGVHLAGRALHEEEDAGFGLALEMGGLGYQGILEPAAGSAKGVLEEQRGKGQASEAAAKTEEEIPAPQPTQARIRIGFHLPAEVEFRFWHRGLLCGSRRPYATPGTRTRSC